MLENRKSKVERGDTPRASVPPPGFLSPRRGRVSAAIGRPPDERRNSAVASAITPTRVGQQTASYVTLVLTKN